MIRSLGGFRHKAQMAGRGASPTLEADAEGVIRRITPVLDPIRYKGQAGKAPIFHFYSYFLARMNLFCDFLVVK